MNLEASSWSILSFCFYLGGVFLLALFSHRLLSGRHFLKEYFLGSRTLGMWALAMTYAATSSSGGSFTGFPALIYQYGWILALWIAGYMFVPVICLGLFGKRINQVARKTGAITLPDLFRDRFQDQRLGILIALILSLFLSVYLVAQFKAGGMIVQILLQDSPLFENTAASLTWIPDTFSFLGEADAHPSNEYCLALLLFAGVVILYTSYGGFRAVVWTDVLQGFVMFIGVLLLLYFTLSKAGGLEGATQTLIQESKEQQTEYGIAETHNLVSGPAPERNNSAGFLPFGLAISFFIFWPITGAGQPGTLIRLMAFKNTQVYRWAICTVSFYYFLIYLPLVAIFVCARVILPPLSEPDQVMPSLVTAVAPPFLAGILLAAPFAAIMSTVDSFLLMISSSLVRDIYQRSIHPAAPSSLLRKSSYMTTIIVGLIVTIGALNPPRFLQDIVVFASTGLACCFLAPITLALYWKRATAAGMIWAIASGVITTLALYALNWYLTKSIGPYNLWGILPAIWGLLVSFLAGIIGSIYSSPPPEHLVRFYFYKNYES